MDKAPIEFDKIINSVNAKILFILDENYNTNSVTNVEKLNTILVNTNTSDFSDKNKYSQFYIANFLIQKLSISDIKLIGFYGYTDHNVLMIENQEIIDYFKNKKNISYTALTPTVYKNIETFSIYKI